MSKYNMKDISERGRIWDSVLSNDVFTPEHYAKTYLKYSGNDSIVTIDELRKYMDAHEFSHVWDYPLEEITEIMENEGSVVLVVDQYTARWFEALE